MTMKFKELKCHIISDLQIFNESPFILVFKGFIKGDICNVYFIGDKARTLSDNIKKGDHVFIDGEIREDGTVLVEYCRIEYFTNTTGDNLNTWT